MARPGVSPGMKKNMLTAVRFDHSQSKDKYWLFQCECGKEAIIRASSFLTGRTKSCGCLVRTMTAKRMTTHGMSRTPLFGSWHSMKSRCLNPNATGYAGHGGKGVSICEEWVHDFPAFAKWSYEHGYQAGMQLDRIDNDGDYTPENCQWLSKSEHCAKTHRDLGRRGHGYD